MRVGRDGQEHMEVAINAQLVSFGQSYRNAGVSRYTQTLLEAWAVRDRPPIASEEQHYSVLINASELAAAGGRTHG